LNGPFCWRGQSPQACAVCVRACGAARFLPAPPSGKPSAARSPRTRAACFWDRPITPSGSSTGLPAAFGTGGRRVSSKLACARPSCSVFSPSRSATKTAAPFFKRSKTNLSHPEIGGDGWQRCRREEHREQPDHDWFGRGRRRAPTSRTIDQAGPGGRLNCSIHVLRDLLTSLTEALDRQEKTGFRFETEHVCRRPRALRRFM
jgi:hypothetical protein